MKFTYKDFMPVLREYGLGKNIAEKCAVKANKKKELWFGIDFYDWNETELTYALYAIANQLKRRNRK